MTGKDLFEGLSFIDERFIEEAENASLVRAPWLRIVSIAACLCLVLFSLWCIHPTQIGPPPETMVPYDPFLPEGWPEVIVYVEEMTEDGFTGTVAELVMPGLFELDMELEVRIPEDAQIEVQILPGSFVLVVCDEYDSDTGIIIARFISPGRRKRSSPTHLLILDPSTIILFFRKGTFHASSRRSSSSCKPFSKSLSIYPSSFRSFSHLFNIL